MSVDINSWTWQLGVPSVKASVYKVATLQVTMEMCPVRNMQNNWKSYRDVYDEWRFDLEQ